MVQWLYFKIDLELFSNKMLPSVGRGYLRRASPPKPLKGLVYIGSPGVQLVLCFVYLGEACVC